MKILAGTIGGRSCGTCGNDLRLSDAEASYPKSVQEFVLRKEEGAKLGMVCGGSNLVYFESN